MGHASIQTTLDLYGKLMPGSEAEAAALVDAYLTRVTRHPASRKSRARAEGLRRQYRITKSEARKFEDAIAAAHERGPSPDVHLRVHDAMIEALESEFAVLREELKRYEALKSGKVKTRKVRSLRELPVLLIEGRIAARLTHRELAKRLDLPEQQIQRYEATLYASVSLERLQEVADTSALRSRSG